MRVQHIGDAGTAEQAGQVPRDPRIAGLCTAVALQQAGKEELRLAAHDPAEFVPDFTLLLAQPLLRGFGTPSSSPFGPTCRLPMS